MATFTQQAVSTTSFNPIIQGCRAAILLLMRLMCGAVHNLIRPRHGYRRYQKA